MGSGSFLLNTKKYAAEPRYIKYYGQELNTSTYNLARMNMFLHGIVAYTRLIIVICWCVNCQCSPEG